MVNDLSEAEVKLFKAFNAEITKIENPIQAYRSFAIRCFIYNITGPHVEALRRACKAIGGATHWRTTKEWDELIKFE